MRKRVKKKNRLGRFIELGFEFDVIFTESVSPNRANKFINDFILFLEDNGMQCFSITDSFKSSGLIGHLKNYKSLSNDDIKKVVEYLKDNDVVDQVKAGKLVDTWRL